MINGYTDTIQNTSLYSTFAVFGFFGGTFVNRLGVKYTMAFGGLGYCIYVIALLVSVKHHVDPFNIVAGALLGICAGLLWTAQGTIMISYPTEAEKGRYFAWFWGIFNMGAVIGGLVSLEHIHDSASANFSRSPWDRTSTFPRMVCLRMPWAPAPTSRLSCSCVRVLASPSSSAMPATSFDRTAPASS